MDVIAKKISKKSLFKLLFIGFFFGLGITCILFGVAAFFGAETVSWNGEVKQGVEGLIYGVLMGPLMALFFSFVFWLFLAFGLWIYSFFGNLKVSFKNVVESAS